MKVLAVLDVSVHVFDDVFRKWGGEDAAMAEGPVTKFRSTLAPGDDLLAAQKLRHLPTELFFAGHVLVDDFGVVQHGLNLRGREARAEREVTQGLSRLASGVFASKQRGTEGGAGIAGDRLDIDVFEATAGFQSPNEKRVQKETSGETDGIDFGALAKFRGNF